MTLPGVGTAGVRVHYKTDIEEGIEDDVCLVPREADPERKI